jgi:CO dehydrogenase/acetyl-CoA synthase alpha subunit
MFITYPQPNGQVAVVAPTGDVAAAIKDVPRGYPYKIVSSLNIDNDYFNAYEYDETDGAKVNLEKAKVIHKDKWRAARKPKLEKLDIDFMKAVEAGDSQKQSEIAAQKQALRDVTNTPLDGATLEEIKAVWPAILN